MNHVYFYELLLPTGATRFGIDTIAVEKVSSAIAWLERTYEDSVVVRIHKLPNIFSDLIRGIVKMFKGSIKVSEVAGLMRDLAIMSGSGIPVLNAIQSIVQDGEADTGRQVVLVCKRLLEDLNAGNSLGEAFARQPDVFVETVRGLVMIGDESGMVSEMLLEAANHLERVHAMRADAKQALIYPGLSLLAVIGAGAFWIIFVLPNLLQMFKQMNAKLPTFTVKVLAGAEWLSDNGIYLLTSIILTVFGAFVIWRQSRAVRSATYRLMHKTPIIRTILVSSGVAFFAEYLGILLRAGIDVVKSFRILEDTQTDLYYVDKISEMRKIIESGDRIATAMRRVGGFPSLLVRMIAVGEDSGSIDRQLSHVALEYSARLRRIVDTLGEVIKPIFILIVGGVFMVLIVALLLPVYSLIGQSMAIPH